MDKYRLVEEKFIGAQDFIDTTTAADNAGYNSYRSTNNTQEQWSKSPHHSNATIVCCEDGTTMNHDIRGDDQFKLQQQQQQRNIVRITQQAKPRNCITTAMNMLVRKISLLLLSTYYLLQCIYYFCHLTPSLHTSVYIGQWDK
jgi:hypothetical protein